MPENHKNVTGNIPNVNTANIAVSYYQKDENPSTHTKRKTTLAHQNGAGDLFFGEYYGLPLPLFVPSTLYSFLLKGLQLAFRLGCVMGPNIPGLESPYWEWSSEYNERERLLGVHVQINPR